MPAELPLPTDALDDLFGALRTFLDRYYPGAEPEELRVVLRLGRRPIKLPVPPQRRSAFPPAVAGVRRLEGPAGPPAPRRAHGEEFRSVVWEWKAYSLTPKQAKVIQMLWQAWENGTPEVGHDALLRAADSDGLRLSDLFKRSAAWSQLMVEGERLGTYRLAPPAAD